MDKNQIIGISLITVLMLGYFGFMSTQKPETPVATPHAITQSVTDTIKAIDVFADTALKAQNQREYGDFAQAMLGESKDVVLENKDVVVTLSTHGGTIKSVLLKNYFTWDKKPLFLFHPENNQLSLTIITNKNNTVDLYKLYYAAYETTVGDNKSVTFKTDAGNGKSISHTYTLGAEGFAIEYKVQATGFGSELPNLPLTLDWREQVERIEYDAEQARIKTTVNYMADRSS
jgi:YidC/Oxa1 family membrane protein insertase